jgi:hypothetical protein
MKHSQSSIFSEKSKDNFIKTGFSIINHNTLGSSKFNNSVTSIKFPRIHYRLKLKKLNKKNKTQYNDNIDISKSIENKSFKDSFNILHFDKKDDIKSTKINKILQNLRYNKDNENPNKNITLLYNNYQNIKNKVTNYFNIYDYIFNVKIKKNDYRKSLSSDYEKDNKNVINTLNIKFKQKNDSILNVIRNNDGFYIKGLKYKKYFFFPHKKMNILSFHHNIMSKNIDQIKERRKFENFRKKKNEEKNNRNLRKTYFNNEDNSLIENAFNNRSRKRHWTKNYVIRKKIKHKIEEIVEDEINNVLQMEKKF